MFQLFRFHLIFKLFSVFNFLKCQWMMSFCLPSTMVNVKVATGLVKEKSPSVSAHSSGDVIQ